MARFRAVLLAVGIALVAACTPGTGPGTTTTTTPSSDFTAPAARRQPLALGGADPSGTGASVSSDGGRVAFLSNSDQLVDGTGGMLNDRLFVWNTADGSVIAQPDGVDGRPPAADAVGPVISGDGTVVAFASEATNLAEGPIFPERRHLYLWEVGTMTVRRGPAPLASIEGRITISTNGRRVAYVTSVANPAGPLTPGAPVLRCDLAQVWDRDFNVTITQPVPGSFDWADCSGGESASLSPDGRYVAFAADARTLTAGDTNEVSDVYLWDTLTGAVTRAVGPAGEMNGPGFAPTVSAGGTAVSFISQATNLAPGRSVGIYVWNTGANTFEPQPLGVGTSAPGAPSGPSPVISSDGTTVAFSSSAGRLVPGDTNGTQDVFVWSRPLGTVTRIAGLGGANPDGPSNGPVTISATGRFVPFTSQARNLLENRSASTIDDQVYLLDRQAPTDVADTAAPVWPAGGRLIVTRMQSALGVGWPAATDDRAVTGYVVTRDGVVVDGKPSTAGIDPFPSTARSHLFGGVAAGAPTTIEVRAIDAAGRSSVLSQTVTPSKVIGPSIGVTDGHGCAVTPNRTVRCWGSNKGGELGNGTSVDSELPVDVVGLTGVSAVSTGSYLSGKGLSCALLTGGTVSCWGYLSSGATAVPDFNSLTPVAIPDLSGVVALTSGGRHVCALLSGGTVKCWGVNVDRELGIGSTTLGSLTPVEVAGVTGATAIAAGLAHTCVLVAGGAVKCWGFGPYGQLGDGLDTTSATPVDAVGITGATAITAGGNTTCAIVPAGVRCWGDDSYGQVGDGVPGADALVPVAVSGIGAGQAAAVVAGTYSTCALLVTDQLKCWGDNRYGQLGDGTTSRRSTPVTSRVSGAVAFDLGSTSACAVLSSDGIQCWGRNSVGQLGTGDNDDSLVPRAVRRYTTPPCSVIAQYADLRRCNLSGAQLAGSSLISADLSGADLSSANLSSVNFQSTGLVGTNFSGANLSSAFFFNSTATNANLSGVNAPAARLGGGKFGGASFRGADLRNAQFVFPFIGFSIGTDLSNSDMTNAVLTGATGLGSTPNTSPQTNLTGVVWQNTTCPNGIVRSTPCT